MRLSSSLAFALFAIGIAALLSSEFINFDIHNYRVIFYGVPAVAILLGALLLEQNGWMTTSRFILLQGAASYSIYLFHVLALQASAKGFSIIAPGSGLKVELLTSVLAAGIAGTMIHLMLEKPMTSFWKRSGRRVVRV